MFPHADHMEPASAASGGADGRDPRPHARVCGVWRRRFLLALQRSAGNAAVAGWLQRDAKLEDVGAAAKDLIVDTEPVRLSGLPVQFKNPRVAARPGLTVQTEFGGEMAATPDPKTEKTLRTGLESIAMIIFGLDADLPPSPDMPPAKGPRRPPTGNRVNIKDLDLTRWGRKDGRYRFTSITRRHQGGQLKAVDLIVELLEARRAPFKKWSELDAAARKQLQGRFDRFGYVRYVEPAGGTAPILPWKDDEFGMVLQALAFVPEDMLAGVRGIVWARGHQPSAPKGEAGSYETKTGTRRATNRSAS